MTTTTIIVLIAIGVLGISLLAVNLFFTTFNFISQQSLMQTLKDVSLMNRITLDSLTFLERVAVNINAVQNQMLAGMMAAGGADEDGSESPKKLFGTTDGKITASSPEELVQKIMDDPEYKKLIDSSEVNMLRNLFETNTDHTLDKEEEEPEPPKEEPTDGA